MRKIKETRNLADIPSEGIGQIRFKGNGTCANPADFLFDQAEVPVIYLARCLFSSTEMTSWRA